MFENYIDSNEPWGISSTQEDSWDPNAPEEVQDDLEDRYARMLDKLEKKERLEQERRAFEGKRLQGKNAHAYKHGLDNQKIYSLKVEGKSYREIGRLLGCSPNTVRNRLNKFRK